jgi:hypothetical protein
MLLAIEVSLIQLRENLLPIKRVPNFYEMGHLSRQL